jgi:hypothetical protein
VPVVSCPLSFVNLSEGAGFWQASEAAIPIDDGLISKEGGVKGFYDKSRSYFNHRIAKLTPPERL